VTGSSGALVDAGQLYQLPDGRRYKVTAAVTLVDGTANLALEAEDVGALGNVAAGTLTAVTPVLGVNASAVIGADGIVGGAELEELEALRGRVQAAFKNPSKVGNGDDFVEWALEVPGVTRAWALPRWMGPGTFGLAFVRDGDLDIIPTAPSGDGRGLCPGAGGAGDSLQPASGAGWPRSTCGGHASAARADRRRRRAGSDPEDLPAAGGDQQHPWGNRPCIECAGGRCVDGAE
jgi:hypothetical protein